MALLLIKGKTPIRFHPVGAPEKKRIVLPRGLWMLHDPSGESGRVCDVFFAKAQSVPDSEVSVSESVRKQAQDYYGMGHKPRYAKLDLNGRRWKRVGPVDRIEYHRVGLYDHDGGYFHPYEVPVMLFQSGGVYRLSLPGGCILDDHGYVKP